MKKKIITLTTILLLFTVVSHAQIATTKKDTAVFTMTEKEAKFHGGIEGWKKYIETNLDASLAKYIKLKKGQKLGQQTVKVQFLVDKTGKVSNVEVVNKDEIHPKLAKEALRVIKEGPDWEPAEQNGKKVLYQATQYITWQAEQE
jgi:protein TonB